MEELKKGTGVNLRLDIKIPKKKLENGSTTKQKEIESLSRELE